MYPLKRRVESRRNFHVSRSIKINQLVQTPLVPFSFLRESRKKNTHEKGEKKKTRNPAPFFQAIERSKARAKIRAGIKKKKKKKVI